MEKLASVWYRDAGMKENYRKNRKLVQGIISAKFRE